MSTRAPRSARVFDGAGVEVFVTYRCSKCGKSRPLSAFGLRKMNDGKIRSIPQCRPCRSDYPRKEQGPTIVHAVLAPVEPGPLCVCRHFEKEHKDFSGLCRGVTTEPGGVCLCNEFRRAA